MPPVLSANLSQLCNSSNPDSHQGCPGEVPVMEKPRGGVANALTFDLGQRDVIKSVMCSCWCHQEKRRLAARGTPQALRQLEEMQAKMQPNRSQVVDGPIREIAKLAGAGALGASAVQKAADELKAEGRNVRVVRRPYDRARTFGQIACAQCDETFVAGEPVVQISDNTIVHDRCYIEEPTAKVYVYRASSDGRYSYIDEVADWSGTLDAAKPQPPVMSTDPPRRKFRKE